MLAHPSSSVVSLAFEPTGARVIASSNDDASRQAIEVVTGRATALPRHACTVFAGDGSGCVGTADRWLQWTSNDGGVPRPFLGHRDNFQSLSLARDGKSLATSEADGEIRVWDVATGQPTLLGRHGDAAHGVALHPGGEWVASGGKDRTVRLWNTHTPARYVLPVDGRALWVVRFSKDGARLGAVGDAAAVTLWDTRDLTQAPTLLRRLGEGLGANEFDFGADGLVAAGASDQTVRVWSAAGADFWHAPVVLPGCVAWPQLTVAASEAAERAGLTREIARRPASCGEDSLAAECARRSTQPAAFDDTHVAVACDGAVEVLERGSSNRVLHAPPAGRFDVAQAGLLRLGDDRRLSLQPWTGPERWALDEVLAFARGGDSIGVVTRGGLAEVDAASGVQRAVVANFDGRSVSALGHDRGAWLVGFASGEVRVYARDGITARRPFASAPVTVLAAQTGLVHPLVFIGHANGIVEAWERGSDRLVWSEQLHGAVETLNADADGLLVLSSLGDWRRLPLGDFERAWCDLMREIWAEAPARWEDGRIQRRASRCARVREIVGRDFPTALPTRKNLSGMWSATPRNCPRNASCVCRAHTHTHRGTHEA